MFDFVQAWGRATIAELCWIGPTGPSAVTVVPLVLDETGESEHTGGSVPRVCAALPFSEVDAALALRGRPAAFAVTDQRRARATTMAGFGRAQVDFDLDGSVFVDRLLEQEIVKYPPTRLRADSLMARRENWWWVARALITLPTIERTAALPGRTRAQEALLVGEPGRDNGDSAPSAMTPYPALFVVAAPSWPAETGDRIELYPRDGALLEGSGQRGHVHGYQHSPDLERFEHWHRSGRLQGEQLVVSEGTGAPAEELRPFGLVERFRYHRSVARSCRAGIAAVESELGR